MTKKTEKMTKGCAAGCSWKLVEVWRSIAGEIKTYRCRNCRGEKYISN